MVLALFSEPGFPVFSVLDRDILWLDSQPLRQTKAQACSHHDASLPPCAYHSIESHALIPRENKFRRTYLCAPCGEMELIDGDDHLYFKIVSAQARCSDTPEGSYVQPGPYRVPRSAA